MKNYKKILLIVACTAILTACGSKKTNEEKAENTSTESPETTISQNVNTNLSIPLKEIALEKAELTVGLPEKWTVNTLMDWGGEISYQVKRDCTDVMLIDTRQDKESEDNMQSLLERFSDGYQIISKEDLPEKDNVKIIGVANFNEKNKAHRQVQFRYVLKFSKGKTKFIDFTPGDEGYNSKSIDTCIAIIKSIKLKK